MTLWEWRHDLCGGLRAVAETNESMLTDIQSGDNNVFLENNWTFEYFWKPSICYQELNTKKCDCITIVTLIVVRILSACFAISWGSRWSIIILLQVPLKNAWLSMSIDNQIYAGLGVVFFTLLFFLFAKLSSRCVMLQTNISKPFKTRQGSLCCKRTMQNSRQGTLCCKRTMQNSRQGSLCCKRTMQNSRQGSLCCKRTMQNLRQGSLCCKRTMQNSRQGALCCKRTFQNHLKLVKVRYVANELCKTRV